MKTLRTITVLIGMLYLDACSEGVSPTRVETIETTIEHIQAQIDSNYAILRADVDTLHTQLSEVKELSRNIPNMLSSLYSLTQSMDSLKVDLAQVAVDDNAQSAEMVRAQALQGYWSFEYTQSSSGQTFRDEYNLTTVTDETTEEGEYIVTGISNLNLSVFAQYSRENAGYLLFDLNFSTEIGQIMSFQVTEDGYAEGIVIFFVKADPTKYEVMQLHSSSGRTNGFSARKPASAAAKEGLLKR